MKTPFRSKWLFALVLAFAGFGALVAFSLIETPLTGAPVGTISASADFVPVVYAEPPGGSDFEILSKVNSALRDLATRSRHSVVRITTTQRPASRSDDEGSSRRQRQPFRFDWPFNFEHPDIRPDTEAPLRHGVGSGVIVSGDGYILTNNHVVADAERIDVTLDDGREFRAKVIGADERTDIAVVKIDASSLTAMPFGDSDALDVGELVIAIGAPFHLSHSASIGIVSAKGRTGVIPPSRSAETAPYEDFIQTDAAINPGNSGGPLVNIRGELIGVNTAISSRTGQSAGIGFAIPSNMARKAMEDLISTGRVVRAWLGVMIAPVDEAVAEKLDMGRPRGAVVSNIVPGSPASKTDLQPLDVIVEMDGTQVESVSHLRNYISSASVGKTVTLGILRDGKERDVRVTLAELDEDAIVAVRTEGRVSTHNWMGLTVEELTEESAAEHGYEDADGVIVVDVERNSPAAREKLEPNMLIFSVGGEAVSNVAEFRSATEAAGDSALVKWRRGANYGLSVLETD